MQLSYDNFLFGLLKNRGVAPLWAERLTPRADLDAECRVLANDEGFTQKLDAYLIESPVTIQSLDTVLAQLAFSAGVHWQKAPDILKPLARRGWHISRWLPTFLLIDGPLGRLLRNGQSPLSGRLRTDYISFPLLASSRDAFNHDLFRRVRNGFAHWSFTWQNNASSAEIGIINNDSGAQDASVSLLECEALHYFSAVVTQSISENLLHRAPKLADQQAAT